MAACPCVQTSRDRQKSGVLSEKAVSAAITEAFVHQGGRRGLRHQNTSDSLQRHRGAPAVYQGRGLQTYESVSARRILPVLCRTPLRRPSDRWRELLSRADSRGVGPDEV